MSSRDLFIRDLSNFVRMDCECYVQRICDERDDEGVECLAPRERDALRRLRETFHSGIATHDDFRWLIHDLLETGVYNTLLVIDNATEMAETVVVRLIDEYGTELGPGIHEHLPVDFGK